MKHLYDTHRDSQKILFQKLKRGQKWVCAGSQEHAKHGPTERVLHSSTVTFPSMIPPSCLVASRLSPPYRTNTDR